MNPVSNNPSFSDHYLQVQALTPVSTSSNQSLPTTSTGSLWQITLLPIFIFFTIFLTGIFLALKNKYSNINFIHKGLTLGLIAAVTTIGLNFINHQTHLSTKAGPDHIPTDVIINRISATEFSVQWQTYVPTIGAARLVSSSTGLETTHTSNNHNRTTTHYILLNNLKPNSKYFLTLFSEGAYYTQPNQPIVIDTKL